LPFFEAYFSNFIEGTKFELDEARGIAFEGRIPNDRTADAHDVLGTFRVVSDRVEMSSTPQTFDEFVSLLKKRHARVMEARQDKGPGQFKTVNNQAGTTIFVAPGELLGTLARGFELLVALRDPFQRAAFMMFLVSEVHPFADGNGRVARIMMNAELVAAGERRVLVPTVFRSNYLSGLKALSQNGITKTLIRSLDFLQRYAVAIDFSTYEGARSQLDATNAFIEGDEGVRLELP
jgi:Fic family protein